MLGVATNFVGGYFMGSASTAIGSIEGLNSGLLAAGGASAGFGIDYTSQFIRNALDPSVTGMYNIGWGNIDGYQLVTNTLATSAGTVLTPIMQSVNMTNYSFLQPSIANTVGGSFIQSALPQGIVGGWINITGGAVSYWENIK